MKSRFSGILQFGQHTLRGAISSKLLSLRRKKGKSAGCSLGLTQLFKRRAVLDAFKTKKIFLIIILKLKNCESEFFGVNAREFFVFPLGSFGQRSSVILGRDVIKIENKYIC